MSQLEDIALRFQVYLEGLKAHDFREFNKVLKLIEASVREELSDGEVSELTRADLERLVRRVSVASREGIREYVDEFIDNLKELAPYSYEFEAGAILTATSVKKLSTKATAEALWKEAIQRPLSATGDLLEPWLKKLEVNQIQAVESLLRRAHAEGWSNKQITQLLTGTRQNRFTDGLLPKLGRGNATIIRTAVQHVNSTSRMKVWAENDDIVKGYRWVSTLDSKTSPVCRGLDQEEFQVGQGPLPPIHPNCRSTTVAVLDPKYNVFRRAATRASATGQVPQTLSYYEWLKMQPKGFQDSVIGPLRGALLREGGLSAEEFTRLQLSSVWEPLTLDEMRRLKPLAFQRAGI